MDVALKKRILDLYSSGYSIREIVRLIGCVYERSSVQQVLKHAGVPLRGRSQSYIDPYEFQGVDAEDFAEFLGSMYGDGYICKVHGYAHDRFESSLAFSLDEEDLVRRIVFIVKKLFGFEPHVVKKGLYIIRLRVSLAKHLYIFGYPVGKKSDLNPVLPLSYLRSRNMKIAFIRGFFNAEATVNKAIAVHQSVRFHPKKPVLDKLICTGRRYVMKKKTYYICTWNDAKQIIGSQAMQSHILEGVLSLLVAIGISASIYPIRLHIGETGYVSVHFELRIKTKCLKKALDFKLVSCHKKVDSLKTLCGCAGAVKRARFRAV